MKIINSISCYCDTEEKITKLIENIEFFKSHGIDSSIVTPIDLPIKVQNMVKFYLKTDYNPVFDWPIHAFSFWKVIKMNNLNIKISTTRPDYGWTTISHIKTMGSFLYNCGYDKIAFTIYDSLLNEKHIYDIKNKKGNLLFSHKRGNDIWEVGTHLMSLDKENFYLFNKLINVEDYLKRNSGIMGFLKKRITKDRFEIINNPVEDNIYHFDTDNFYEYTSTNGLRYFISNNGKVKIFIYNFYDFRTISLIINDNKFDINTQLFECEVNKNEIHEIKIINDLGVVDITEDFKKIKHNKIEII